MTVRANETGEEEDYLKHVEARHWVGATVVGKIEALRDTIFRCYEGFWKRHRELKDQTERTLKTQAWRIDQVEGRIGLLVDRVSELERKKTGLQLDDVLGHVEGKPFTAADILRWRRMERPALALANASWNDRRCWPFPSRPVDEPMGQVKRWMRELSEAMRS